MAEYPVTDLKGVGKHLAGKLASLSIHTVEDLIFHLPNKYQDRTQITPLARLVVGEDALFCAQIEATSVAFGRRRTLLARVSDGTGRLTIRWFYFNRAQQEKILRLNWIYGFATIRQGRDGLETAHPEYQISTEKPENITTDVLTPIYPLTEGITQPRMRSLVNQSLEQIDTLEDYLKQPELNLNMPGLHEALMTVHTPAKNTDTKLLLDYRHPAQKRLVFEELLAHHCSLKRVKAKRQIKQSPKFKTSSKLSKNFYKQLCFSLTDAQRRVVNEINDDVNSELTMQRLVQGDVGSGKTVVAGISVCHAIASGYQVAIMAPTELLAEQHYASFKQWFEPLGVKLCWLSGSVNAANKKQSLAQIASGDADVVIGTHALFQAGVVYKNLGLVVVDEQHRFGVNQRLALIEKGASVGIVPHQLAMTATPIPRTMAMIFYADMDVSSIDELPPGRQPVETILISDERRQQLVERVSNACRSGRQTYWVCPLIDESDAIEAQAATEIAAELSNALPKLTVALIHGKMNNEQKNTVMRDFRDHAIDVLVATTVIEVGVDVPNASLMVIENPERLGLSQLHQLRGRVGRGEIHSCCVLMYHSPLSEMAKKRLMIMRETNDGFKISKYDLELRGPGELFGTRQTGLQQLKIANLVRDRELIPKVEQTGKLFDVNHTHLDGLIHRWVKRAERFADV